MKTFLSKISQLKSIQDVILLSSRGEPLFLSTSSNQQETNKKLSYWNEVIEGLGTPRTLDVVFSEGRSFLRYTEIGYLIITMKNDTNLPKIRVACDNTLHRLSDPGSRKKILLKLLSESDDIFKPNIIKELVVLADKDVAQALIRLLEQEQTFNPEVREKLQLFICQTLGHCSAYEAIEPLNRFLAGHVSNPNAPLNIEIREAVRISIQQLEGCAPDHEQKPPPISRTPSVSSKTTVKPKPTVTRQATRTNPDFPEEATISSLLDKDKKDEAIALIMDLIEKSVHDKDFKKATVLRDKLIKTDSMALTHIVRAAEIIEEGQLSSINKEHLEVWQDLANHLAKDEFAAIYHAMTPKSFANGEFIAKQGSYPGSLFFITKGQVRIQTTSQNTVFPLRIKEAGEILGGSPFFETSVWTTSAKSLGSEVLVLSKKALTSLKEAHPSLESKLRHYCTAFESSSSLIKKTSKNRRQFERKKAGGRLSFAVLDQDGNETGIVAKGDLIDISRGGIAFAIHASQRKNAVGLFGRKLRVSINAGMATGLLVRNAVVHAVKDQDLLGNEYSLHLKFDQNLTSAEMQNVIKENTSDEG